MKDNLINFRETAKMTSVEIAEITGKLHKHILEAIRKMEPAWHSIAGTNFRLGKDCNIVPLLERD